MKQHQFSLIMAIIFLVMASIQLGVVYGFRKLIPGVAIFSLWVNGIILALIAGMLFVIWWDRGFTRKH